MHSTIYHDSDPLKDAFEAHKEICRSIEEFKENIRKLEVIQYRLEASKLVMKNAIHAMSIRGKADTTKVTEF
jgi:hypothetical protein